LKDDTSLSHFELIMVNLVHIESYIIALQKYVVRYEDSTLDHSFKVLLGIVNSIRSYLLKGKDEFVSRGIK